MILQLNKFVTDMIFNVELVELATYNSTESDFHWQGQFFGLSKHYNGGI